MLLTLLLLLCFIQNINTFNINVGSTGILFSYTLGALAYIKTHVKPTNYNLVGISGGSWCSIIYHFEKDMTDHDNLWSTIVGNKNESVSLLNKRNMYKFQRKVAENFRHRYADKDISGLPLSIITTELQNRKAVNVIIDKYDNLDDLINYCICSSYIPYICGNNFYTIYKNKKYIDGELFKNEGLLLREDPMIYLHKNTWNRKFNIKDHLYLDFNRSKVLFENGWKDAEKYL
jgi:hypothetical protein